MRKEACRKKFDLSPAPVLWGYLEAQSLRTGETHFTIPFDRQALADYLGVERSAMSAELSRMRKDALIDYRKNSFEILDSGYTEERHG